jgi:thiol-disulfide isomerase/thioredoxin
MKKHTFFSLLLLLSGAVVHAQTTLRGTVINQPGNRSRILSVDCWITDHWQQAAGGNIHADNSFEIAVPNAVPGQYRLRMFGEAKLWNDFIIPDSSMTEPVLTFALDYKLMDGGPAVTIGSKANALYFNLMSAYRARMEPNAPPGAIVTLNQRCKEILAQSRKSLIGDIALLLYDPQKEDYPGNAAIQKMSSTEFTQVHALEKIPFEHESILRHNAFVKVLNRYDTAFEDHEKGDNAFIDGVMARRNGNEAVDGFVFRYLLDKLMERKNDPSLSYLLKWYTPDCPEDEPLPSHIQNLLEALKVCAPGKMAPDLNFRDLEGKVVNLNAVCAKNKLTMLLFWRSTCSHCKELEPVLMEVYKKYHPLGLEVYALSSDRTEETLRTALQNTPTPWINVYIPPDQRVGIDRIFPTPSTPTLIVLDKNRRVVSRMLSRTNLEAYLDTELAKHK